MNRTRYSPRDMELIAGVGQQSVIETPRGTEVFPQRNTQTHTTRRNLLGTFEDEESEQTIPMEKERSDFPQPVDTGTPLVSEPSVEEENKTRWSGFLFIWTVIFAIGGFIMFLLHKYFPGYMLMCLTKEFLISGSLTVLCAILASAVLRHIVQNRKSAQRQHFRKSVTPRTSLQEKCVTGNACIEERNCVFFSGSIRAETRKTTPNNSEANIQWWWYRYLERVHTLFWKRRRIEWVGKWPEAESAIYCTPWSDRDIRLRTIG